MCSFTAWFSLLKYIYNDHKFKTWRQKMYIFIPLHIVNQYHTKSAVFLQKFTWWLKLYGAVLSVCGHHVSSFSPKMTTITNVILILYNSSINKKLILRDLCFRHHIACFYSISTTKIIPNTVLCLWATWRCFVPEWINFKWFGSITTIHLLTDDLQQFQRLKLEK